MASHWALAFLALLAHVAYTSGSLTRKNVGKLSDSEVLSLQSVLRKLEDDNSATGFQEAVASYHGEPSLCTDPKTGSKVACCVHGMATFPQWHRLFVTQFEQSLVSHGLSGIGVPYWDWTQPLKALPPLVQNQIYRDPSGGIGQRNAWFSGDIHITGSKATQTARAVDDRLFQKVGPGEHTVLFDIVLDALEQDDYCQFEVQFEVAHNNIHFLVGGRHDYSMSTLEYSAYDPIFFLHHSNVDRIFAIWQKLQEKRSKPSDHADCSVELFRKPLQPFERPTNPIALTRGLAHAEDLFSYNQLGYAYDDLTLNGLNIDQLYSLLEARKGRERAFAVFALHGIGFSADVKVEVCEGDEEDHAHAHCEQAGSFFILGGHNEMPWEFHLPFYFDISDAVEKLVHQLDGRYHVMAEVYSVNGTSLGHGLLPHVHGSHRPSRGHLDPVPSYTPKSSAVVRKDVDVLTDEEVDSLRQALTRFQADTSVDGFQAVAEFHGLPAKCPHPDAAVRYACCIHGMPTFPHWHRLYVVEVEDELKARGLDIGIPYWDWTVPHAKIPALAADPTYVDPKSGKTLPNPFHHAAIAFLGVNTARDVMDELRHDPAIGDHTPLFDAILLALEQDDFCDFEIQFEVVHNDPHFLVGGYTQYSLSTLHYSAFDPIFYLHHSFVDRLWAIWQKLQIIRGKPYKAHCANTLTHELLKPFGFPPPWNNDKKTFDNARPTNIYDYTNVLDYTYDSLQFGGMSPDQLEHYLDERKTHDRVFVGIGLHQIGVSARATVQLQHGQTKRDVGSISVLGGEKEMPWRFDRLYKVEITDALKALGLNYKDDFEVHLKIKDVTGKDLDENVFSHDTIIYEPGTVHQDPEKAEVHVRSDVEHLTREQVQNLRDAFEALEADTSIGGFGQIAAFHGQPIWCPSTDAENKVACCTHGMAIFPHWHRLLTVQAENALRQHGLKDGLPYWDWTLPMDGLPQALDGETYVNAKSQATVHNPLHDGSVDGHTTTRSVRPELFEKPAFGKFTQIAKQVILAFEQTDFCDFEVQFEIAHNYIHALVGGKEAYSMASLRFTAFDPIFFFHHSNTDRLWAIWQKLQKYRGLPYNSANCALAAMRVPLKPFSLGRTVNPDSVTSDHAVPFDVFNYKDSFHYKYDDLDFNGLSISQIQREIMKRQHDDRAFAGFLLHGIKESALVVFDICKPTGKCKKAGEFYLLGDPYEIPWSYDRLFKYDITHQLKDFHLDLHDNFWVHYDVFNLAGDSLGTEVFGNASVVLTTGHATGSKYFLDLASSSHVRRNIDDLNVGEMESLKSALLDMENDGTFEQIAKFHGYPGLCTHNGHKVGCCVHGTPTFPHWHRLYVEQVENELLKHGSAVSVPYWDWTQAIRQLPDLINKASFFNSRTGKVDINPFFRGKISDLKVYTTRDPKPDLFNTNYFLNQVLLALEQTSFCDFEIQYEIIHNALHSFLGGLGEYSLSGLDYSAFDPVFFLHHSFVDKLWAIWQGLQKNRGLPFEEADCALNLMRKPLQPFADATINRFDTTIHYSRPVDVYDYSGHLGYHYDNLDLNSWNLDQLEQVLKKQRSRDRLFAGFLLHSIGQSADVEIYICIHTSQGSTDCDHPAGKFALLGGSYEMPFTFDRLYKYDISNAVVKLGYRLDSYADFDIQIKVKNVNGSYIDANILPKPSILFVPGEGKHQDDHGHTQRNLIRKDIQTLSVAERRSLVLAMRGLQEDHSADGFQSLAAFHALPPLCPEPTATKRFACCVHGMATFPMWHRLYTVQFEDALRRHGSIVGIPYLDSLEPMSGLPEFLTEEKFHDSLLDTDLDNPWIGATIDFKNATIKRDVKTAKLAAQGKHGYDTWSFKQYIYALEQENFCDFEIQFEMAHNAIHSWVGGSEHDSMNHLHYASYDPAFIVHHSFTDRIFAIWQALQKHRGHDPYEVTCALEAIREPLKPFSFGAPYNLNLDTKTYSKAEDTLDYTAHFHYEYDTLEFQGKDVVMIEDYINDKKEKDRVFAGFLLKGIGRSAHVHFYVCTSEDDSKCHDAGFFDILGGSAEMPWRFDRLYKYEITDVLSENHIDVRDPFHIRVEIKGRAGDALDSSVIPEPTVILDSKDADRKLQTVAPNRVRRDLTQLNERDIMGLKSALADLKADDGIDGFQSIARFHGAPAMCPTPEAAEHACCVHGMPTFPHWHRLYTVEIEDALVRHGASSALPYWDWTRPIDKLPDLFTQETYYDAWRDEVKFNPFARGFIKHLNGYTVREAQPELTKLSRDGQHSVLFDEVLLALEQTDFCDFEVQYEVLHNAIHYLVGGHHKFSLSSLEYSAYDPIFYVHHTMMDKIWVVWQELQKRRHQPHDRADCAVNYMNEKMHPFDWSSYNADVRTREHAIASSTFDYEDLGYQYDNFELGGNNLEQLEALIKERQSHARVFAGLLLRGIQTSADIVLQVCKTNGDCVRAGGLFILGGPLEMPWAFDRLYKYDITDVLDSIDVSPEKVFDPAAPFNLKYEVHAVNGSTLPKSVISKPSIIYEPAHEAEADHTKYTLAGIGVRKDINTLTDEEIRSLRDALRKVQAGETPVSFEQLAEYHGYPGLCKQGDHTVACCHHGMASFPQWHRLYVKALEVQLTEGGARVGVPYWDWTKAFTELPSLVRVEANNPFHDYHIKSKNKTTSRAPRPQLFTDPEHGDTSFFYRQVLLALEQRDYCNFEVQFEVIHNAIHSWIGGPSEYGLSTLEFSAYDPLFFIHHSNVDRLFAIWQALQQYRGLDYNTANCNIQELRLPLEPFNKDSDPIIRDHATAIETFNYDQLNYQYDNLNFHGLTIAQLDELLDTRKREERVFANFMLHGIRTSADVVFDLCDEQGHCSFAGTFAILGGQLEMPWSFDRLFKYDVTAVFKQMRLRTDSAYHFDVKITGIDGRELDSSLLHAPSVSSEHGSAKTAVKDDVKVDASEDAVRYEVSEMSLEQVSNLRNALYKLQNDHGPNGFEAIAGFHGAPGLCPEGSGGEAIACCQHGMPAFPHWHRLLTVQFERALKAKGALVGIPYWDWTRPGKALPSLFTDSYDSNPFKTFRISNGEYVTRDVQHVLFDHPDEGDLESLYHQAIEMLEEDNYCDFEVQYEMLHNTVHALVGGAGTYSMATLGYSAYDPFFIVHHSSIDRLWKVWQQLQKIRHKSFNYARCAGRTLSEPLEPFNYESVNSDAVTKANALPVQIFDTEKFHYHYDNLKVNGHDISELQSIVTHLRDSSRVYAALLLHGFGQSASVEVFVVSPSGEKVHAGFFYVLGGPQEMPWAYERPYKLDITDAVRKAGQHLGDTLTIKTAVKKYDGTDLPDVSITVSTFIERPANTDYDVLVVQIGQQQNAYYKVTVKRGTKVRFHATDDASASAVVRELGSFTAAQQCVIPPGKANSYKLDHDYQLQPGDYYFSANDKALCQAGRKVMVTIEDE